MTYEGPISLSATTINKKSQEILIGFSVDVVADVSYDWEEDEQLTGWNHGTDSPTYSSSVYAVASDPQIHSVQFSHDTNFIIDNEEVSLHEAQQIIDPSVLKQLLNPSEYSKLMASAFNKQVENIDPPEPEFDDGDRDYDDRDY